MSTHPPAATPSLTHDPGQGVAGGCGGCAACGGGGGLEGVTVAASALGGASLVAAAAVFFLLPLVTAMGAASLVGVDRRSLAALLGLAAGLGTAIVIAREWTRRLERVAPPAAAPLAPRDRAWEETHHG